MSETFADAARERDEHRQLQLREALDVRARVLLLIGEDEVGLEARNRVHVDVLRSADDRYLLRLLRGHAIPGAAYQAISRTQREDVERVARHQRDDPPRRTDEQKLTAAVVVDAQRHRSSSIIAPRCAPWSGSLP